MDSDDGSVMSALTMLVVLVVLEVLGGDVLLARLLFELAVSLLLLAAAGGGGGGVGVVCGMSIKKFKMSRFFASSLNPAAPPASTVSIKSDISAVSSIFSVFIGCTC